MLNNKLLPLFIFVIFNLSAQVKFVDNENKFVIPYVQLISEKGIVLAISNIEGIVFIDSLVNLKTKITVSHPSYYEKTINKDNLKNASLYLIPKRITLNEVVVNASKKQIDYTVLKGFFRSYQIENNVPKFYSDGIVEFYIPTKENKKTKENILEHRTFRNKKLVENRKKRTFDIPMENFDIPYISNTTTLDNLENSYSIEKTGKYQYKIVNENQVLGAIRIDSLNKLTNLNVDIFLKNKNRIRKIFKFRGKFTNYAISETYDTTKLPYKSIDKLKIKKDYLNTSQIKVLQK